MKFLEAFKDLSGYHYKVQLDENDANSPVRNFNYSPRVPFSTGKFLDAETGTLIPDPTGATEDVEVFVKDPTGATVDDPNGATEDFVILEPGTGKVLGTEKQPVQVPNMIPEIQQRPRMIPLIVKAPEFKLETEEEYTARIEAEIIETCKGMLERHQAGKPVDILPDIPEHGEPLPMKGKTI